jgi:opacity protein-like surface antigen
MFRVRTVILALSSVAVFASAPVMAKEHKHRAFITADWVSPLATEDVDFETVQDAVQGTDDFGFEAGYEYRFTDFVGLEGSYLIGSNDFELQDADTTLGSVDQQAITAALNFHVLPGDKRFDLWFAPLVSWYSFGDFDIDDAIDSEDVELNTEWGYGAAVGFDVGLGSSQTVAITGGVRYVKVELAGEDFSGVDFDPLIARVGLAFRWGTR